jgi:hypothetical protein
MDFIMQGWLSINNRFLLLIVSFFLFSQHLYAEDFSALISNVKVKQKEDKYILNANIDYRLSPIAKEALQKGIALTWTVIIKVQQEGRLWDPTIKEIELSYRIRNHALLNLYSVKKAAETHMFSTLTAAMNSISKIRKIFVIDKQLLQYDENYHLSMKVKFNREALPVPLRPMSYFGSQWALSSEWSIWQLQN